MRWGHKYPKVGDTRKYTRFAWLPVQVGKEVRWLETVTTFQEYKEMDFFEYYQSVWEDVEFLDKKE